MNLSLNIRAYRMSTHFRPAQRHGAFLFGLAFLFSGSHLPVRAQNATDTINFYVATNGRDVWSGKLSQPNAANSDGPFATLERARDAIRSINAIRSIKSETTAPFTVSLRAGTYALKRAFQLDEQDSGSDAAPVTYQAYRGEKVTLSGGRSISGWQRGRGQIYTVQLPEVQAGRWNFNALFVNGRRATRARTPNQGRYYNIVAPSGPDFAPGSDPTYYSFRFHAGDVDPAWKNLNEIEVVSNRRASQSRAFIAAVEGDRVRLQSYASKYYGWEEWNGGQDRYYLDNIFEGLDSPGEWYLDRKSGTLSYWPLSGENMAMAQVSAPVLLQLLDMRGATERMDLSQRAFTIAAWIKTSANEARNLVSNWFPNVQYQMTARNNSSLNGYTLGLTDGKMIVGLADGRSPLEAGTFGSGLNDNRWHHLAAVFDRLNKRILCYADGKSIGTLPLSHTFDEVEADLPVLLGDFYKQPFEGSLDELRIYSRALSETEIRALNNKSAAPRDHLELAMSFEGNLKDSARAGRIAKTTGTLSYVPGVQGQALHHAYDASTLQDGGAQSFASFPFAPRAPVRNIIIQDLTWSYTGSVLPPSGYPGHQSNMFLIEKPAIDFLSAQNIRFQRNTISHVSGHGLRQRESSAMRLEGNHIFDTSANGISIEGGDHTSITDNTVHDVGATYGEGTGIIVGIQGAVSSDNTIAHNLVFNTPYAGISVGMTWRATDMGQNRNTTEYNHVHHAMQVLNDGGAIYSNGFQEGSVIRNNWVHDIYDVEKTDLFRDAGIYLDNGSKGITVTRNVVARCGNNLFLNDTHGTTITNNIFVDGMASQAFLFSERVSLTHNIFFYGGAMHDAPLYWNNSGAAVSAANGGQADYNLYFNATNAQAGDWQLHSWRDTAGLDRNGRIANPLFRDYARDDFSLRAGSPAFALGFRAIDLSQFGPRF